MRDPVGRSVAWTLLAVILAGSLGLKVNHLGHRAIRGLDEVFHAIVVRNLLKYPLVPTLYERHYLDYDALDWQNATVWMHKPPLAMWQIAASFGLLGETPLALRLPSALLATGSVWLTYLIGATLFNRRVALIAAALHAFNPATFTLVHGYIFSDHVDVAMLFWTELGIWFVARAMSGSRATRDMILAGIAQGLALLSKSYPATIITCVAVVAWLLTRRSDRAIRLRHIFLMIAATILIIAPWTVWCLIKFPREFLAEQALVLRHLHADVERWAAPWDRLIFDYLARSFHVFYPMLLAGIAILGWRAWRERDARTGIVIAWLLGVVVPHMIATSKTPSAALIGWPAGWLILAMTIDRPLRGDALVLGMWVGAMIIGVAWRGVFPEKGMGYPDPPVFAAVLRENSWIAWHALIALTAGSAFVAASRWLSPRDRRSFGIAAACIALAATVTLAAQYTYVAWRITEQNRNDPSYAEIGRFVHSNLPANAVILVDETEKQEHKAVMFWTDRTSYPMTFPAGEMVDRIRRDGGEPYLVSGQDLPLPVLLRSSLDGRTLYRTQ